MISAGPAILWPGFSRLAAEDAGVAPRAVGEDFPGFGRRCVDFFSVRIASRRGRVRVASRALDADRLDDHRLVVVDEAELRLVRRLEGRRWPCRSSRARRHGQRGVGAVVADVQHRPAGCASPPAMPWSGKFREHGACAASRSSSSIAARGVLRERLAAAPAGARRRRPTGRCRRPTAGRRRGGSAPIPCRARRRRGRHAGRPRRRSS